MSRIIRKRKLVALLGVVAAVGIAAVAYAFLSAGGSGSGSGSASAAVTELGLTSSVPALDHIGDSDTITVYATNAGTSPEQLSALYITPTPTAASGKTCPAGSFVVGTPTLTGNQVPAGTGIADKVTVATATVTYTNVNSAQNDCTGYTLALSSTDPNA